MECNGCARARRAYKWKRFAVRPICKRLQAWRMENTCPGLRSGPAQDSNRDLQGIWQVAAGEAGESQWKFVRVTPLTSPVPLTR